MLAPTIDVPHTCSHAPPKTAPEYRSNEVTSQHFASWWTSSRLTVDYLALDLAYRTTLSLLDRIQVEQTSQRTPGSSWHELHLLSQSLYSCTSTPGQIHEWFRAYTSVNLLQIAVAVGSIVYRAARCMHPTRSLVPHPLHGLCFRWLTPQPLSNNHLQR